MKNKETLEEAAETYYEENIDQSNIPREHYEWEIQDLMVGFASKLQQERMYSEEELKSYGEFCVSTFLGIESVTLSDVYLEQFKKK